MSIIYVYLRICIVGDSIITSVFRDVLVFVFCLFLLTVLVSFITSFVFSGDVDPDVNCLNDLFPSLTSDSQSQYYSVEQYNLYKSDEL